MLANEAAGVFERTDQSPSSVLVSVCVITYNQEKYIAQCLQSIVDQETNFDYEVIVGDDCSTDCTREIVEGFSKKYPDKIRTIFHPKNIGPTSNYLKTHELAVGKYIAHVDGDDYLLPEKLQIQANFLDANHDCNIVFHKMNTEQNGKIIPASPSSMMNRKFYRKDIIESGAIASHSSKMYRSEQKHKVFPSFVLTDYTLNVIQVGNGYAAYCSDIPLGVYRKGTGVSGSGPVIESVVETLRYCRDNYPSFTKEVNASAWRWLISNLKNKRPFKFEFLKLILATFSWAGLFRYMRNRLTGRYIL